MNYKYISNDKLEQLALDAYPVEVVKDMDGDWYDINKHLRNAFVVGFHTAIYISVLRDIKLKKKLITIVNK